jgi:hypothetical protein
VTARPPYKKSIFVRISKSSLKMPTRTSVKHRHVDRDLLLMFKNNYIYDTHTTKIEVAKLRLMTFTLSPRVLQKGRFFFCGGEGEKEFDKQKQW